jgi:hypothetical protein
MSQNAYTYQNVILIPYRNRKEHLELFIKNAIPLFENYLKPFKLVIIEQEQGNLFNRGMLLNIGFNEYKGKSNYFFTHDVDIIPTEKGVNELYTKTDTINTGIIGIYNSYCNTLGGIIKFTSDSFIKINGFPNNFWGWGVEDKALQNRTQFINISINKNILNNDNNRFNYFTIKNDIDDRKKNDSFHLKTNFEYDVFNTLKKEEQYKHIMSSGLNNLEYKIINRENLGDNIEIIKVSI